MVKFLLNRNFRLKGEMRWDSVTSAHHKSTLLYLSLALKSNVGTYIYIYQIYFWRSPMISHPRCYISLGCFKITLCPLNMTDTYIYIFIYLPKFVVPLKNIRARSPSWWKNVGSPWFYGFVKSAMKKPWLFDIGDYTTQLYGDYFISQLRRIPIKQPGFNGK